MIARKFKQSKLKHKPKVNVLFFTRALKANFTTKLFCVKGVYLVYANLSTKIHKKTFKHQIKQMVKSNILVVITNVFVQ